MRDKDQKLIFEAYRQLNEEFTMDDAVTGVLNAWNKKEKAVETMIANSDHPDYGTEEKIRTALNSVKEDFFNNVEVIVSTLPEEGEYTVKDILDQIYMIPDKTYGETPMESLLDVIAALENYIARK